MFCIFGDDDSRLGHHVPSQIHGRIDSLVVVLDEHGFVRQQGDATMDLFGLIGVGVGHIQDSECAGVVLFACDDGVDVLDLLDVVAQGQCVMAEVVDAEIAPAFAVLGGTPGITPVIDFVLGSEVTCPSHAVCFDGECADIHVAVVDSDGSGFEADETGFAVAPFAAHGCQMNLGTFADIEG